MPFPELDNRARENKDFIEKAKIRNDQLRSTFWGNAHEDDRLNTIKLNEESIKMAEHYQEMIETYNNENLQQFKKK